MSAVLRSHFEAAVDLLTKKAELAAEIAAWRGRARGEGLVPTVLLKLARDHLETPEQRCRAAELAGIEELYRQGLDLPLFRGRAE